MVQVRRLWAAWPAKASAKADATALLSGWAATRSGRIPAASHSTAPASATPSPISAKVVDRRRATSRARIPATPAARASTGQASPARWTFFTSSAWPAPPISTGTCPGSGTSTSSSPPTVPVTSETRGATSSVTPPSASLKVSAWERRSVSFHACGYSGRDWMPSTAEVTTGATSPASGPGRSTDSVARADRSAASSRCRASSSASGSPSAAKPSSETTLVFSHAPPKAAAASRTASRPKTAEANVRIKSFLVRCHRPTRKRGRNRTGGCT